MIQLKQVVARENDIIVLPDKEQTKTSSGIELIPSKFNKTIATGTVVRSFNKDFPEGTRVIHQPYAYSEIEADDTIYRVMRPEAIIATIQLTEQ